LSDDVIFQLYVEIEGRMRKVMTVIKMRGSEHSKDLRLYDVTVGGLVLGDPLCEYRGIITGVAQRHQTTEFAEPPDTSGERARASNAAPARDPRHVRNSHAPGVSSSIGSCTPALRPLRIVAQHWRSPSSATRPLASAAARNSAST